MCVHLFICSIIHSVASSFLVYFVFACVIAYTYYNIRVYDCIGPSISTSLYSHFVAYHLTWFQTLSANIILSVYIWLPDHFRVQNPAFVFKSLSPHSRLYQGHLRQMFLQFSRLPFIRSVIC